MTVNFFEGRLIEIRASAEMPVHEKLGRYEVIIESLIEEVKILEAKLKEKETK